MRISEILTINTIKVNLQASDKDDAINKMIDLAAGSGNILNIDAVRKCVFEREGLVSTGVGKGFAIPHGKTEEIKDITAAFAVLQTPIDFDSIDQEPVKFIFLLIGKESLLNAHIKLLSRISRLMNKDDFRMKIAGATNEQELMDIFKEEEQIYFDS